MIDAGEPPFSPEEIAETRSIISGALAIRGIRMEEGQIDIAMRRLLLQARASGRSPIMLAREMVRASAAGSQPEERAPGEDAG